MVPEPRSRSLTFFGLGALGMLAAFFGYAAAGWNGAAFAVVPLAAISWFAAPAQNAWRTRRLSDDRSVAMPPPGTALRPRNTITTAFDVMSLALWGRDRRMGWGILLQVLLASVVCATSLVTHQIRPTACFMWFSLITASTTVFVSALSRPSLEFLATRPLGVKRLLIGPLLPWLATVCALPLLALAWSRHGVVGVGTYQVSTGSFVLRLTLTAVGYLCCFSHDALRDPRTKIPLLNVGLYLLLAPLVLPWLCPIKVRHLPWWLPPTWLVAGYAVVVVTLWARRLPWHLLVLER
ncbi:MAG TPA: hypothetical protein VH560_03770 [Polyangia bacterium]|jgi:hypothetical protein|nr:hypothetical protein [Polyangia bacterium]